MNLNNFTIKAQEAITQAQQIAFNNANPNIETEHLLKALHLFHPLRQHLIQKHLRLVFHRGNNPENLR